MVLQNSGRQKFDTNETREREDGTEKRLRRAQENDDIDSRLGFERYTESEERVGWLINMHPADVLDEDRRLVSAVDYYFLEEDGGRFKVSLPFAPYFYVSCKPDCEREVISYVTRKYQGKVLRVESIKKEDLDLHNHLTGLQARYLKVTCHSVEDLIKLKKDLLPAIRKNKERAKAADPYTDLASGELTEENPGRKKVTDQVENIVDIREYDVPYHVRVSIDMNINVGLWYSVRGRGTQPPEIAPRPDLEERPEPVVLAFDIETTKLPLKFPDSQTDQIMIDRKSVV